jgi:hypothetical protein
MEVAGASFDPGLVCAGPTWLSIAADSCSRHCSTYGVGGDRFERHARSKRHGSDFPSWLWREPSSIWHQLHVSIVTIGARWRPFPSSAAGYGRDIVELTATSSTDESGRRRWSGRRRRGRGLRPRSSPPPFADVDVGLSKHHERVARARSS